MSRQSSGNKSAQQATTDQETPLTEDQLQAVVGGFNVVGVIAGVMRESYRESREDLAYLKKKLS